MSKSKSATKNRQANEPEVPEVNPEEVTAPEAEASEPTESSDATPEEVTAEGQYLVVSRLKCDGRIYMPGDVFSDIRHVEALLKSGTIQPLTQSSDE